MKKYFNKIALGLALLSPAMSWSQSTNSINLSITNESFQKLAGGVFNIDLLAEIKKVRPVGAIEIQMIRVDAKASLGGAQMVLKINNQGNDTVVVETDPDQFNVETASTYRRYELRNMDRSIIRSAVLSIQNIVKVKSIEVVLGAAQEPAVFGRYATDAASAIGASYGSDDTRPTDQALSEITASYYGTDEASVLAQQQAQAQASAKAIAEAEAARIAEEEIRNTRSNMAAILNRARGEDAYSVRYYLQDALRFYRDQAALSNPVIPLSEISDYYSSLQALLSQKEYEENERARQLALQKEAERRAFEAARPRPNYAAKDQCLKAKKKKAVGPKPKKEFCIGEYLPGVFSASAGQAQIIDIDKRGKNLIILFDNSNDLTSYPIDNLPNAR